MAGVSIQVRVEDAQLQAALAALVARGANLRAPLAAIGQDLVTLSDQSFRAQADPWGAGWTPLAPSTLKGRRQGPGRGAAQILRDTGRLQSSVNARASAQSVTVGSNVIYAAIQQLGGTIERKARTATLYFKTNKARTEVGPRFVRRGRSNFAQTVTIGAHAVTIPPRAYLPVRPGGAVDLPPAVAAQVLQRLRAHLAGGGPW